MGELANKKCALCGKEIRFSYYDADQYAYRRGYKYFCGYKCTREHDGQEEQRRAEAKEKRRLARERKKNEQQ